MFVFNLVLLVVKFFFFLWQILISSLSENKNSYFNFIQKKTGANQIELPLEYSFKHKFLDISKIQLY